MKIALLITSILLLIDSILLFYSARAGKRQDEFIERVYNPYMLNELLKYTRVGHPDDPIIQQLEHDLHLQPGEELEIKLPKDGQ